MNRFYSLIMSLFFCCGLCFYSCSNQDAEISPKLSQESPIDSISPHRIGSSYSEGAIYVKNNPDLFGSNVLIFDSFEDAEKLLNILSDDSPAQLRKDYSLLGIYNPILESNIIYDSVMLAIAKKMDFDIINNSSEDSLAWFLEEFVHEMRHQYSDYCVIGETKTQNNEYCYTANPLGDIDERALCNNKKLFIVDGVVFKICGDYLLTCPYDAYCFVAKYDDLMDLKDDLQNQEIYGVSRDKFLISSLTNASSISKGEIFDPKYTDDHSRDYSQNKGDYAIDVYITIYPIWTWFETKFRCKMIISNSYRGTNVKAFVSGKFSSTGVAWNNHDVESLSFFKYSVCLKNIWNKQVTTAFKSRTFIDDSYVFKYMPTLNTYVDIKDLILQLIQNPKSNHSVTIDVRE